MSWRVIGWIVALFFVPVAGGAFGFGLWKSGIIYAMVSVTAAPVAWRRRPAASPQRTTSPEKILFCAVLIVAATLSSGVEADSAVDPDRASTPRREGRLAALIGKGGAQGSAAGTGAQNNGSPEQMEARHRQRIARRYRAALVDATDCDQAHRMAAGAILAIRAGHADYDVKQAARQAAARCERSWIAFNGLEVTEMVAERDQEAERLRACNESYFGRWQVNDDLLYALDVGLPPREVDRIERRNDAVETRMGGCSPLLKGQRLPRADATSGGASQG